MMRGWARGWMDEVARRVVRVLGRPLERTHAFVPADAIVILGSPLRPDGALGAVLEERVRAGVDLWRRRGAPVVCMTGGRSPRARHEQTEADAMAAFARTLGVPDDAIVVEREARFTMENATKTAALLSGLRVVWIVTTPFHLRRSMWWFERLGFQPRGWAIEDSVQYDRPWRGLRWVAREYASLARDVIVTRR